MKTLRLTAKDFDDHNFYCGKENVSGFDGDVVISENLGRVMFDKIKVSGSLVVMLGSEIDVQAEIETGGEISAGGSIRAGANGIKAKKGITAKGGIATIGDIVTGGDIVSGEGISALSIVCNGEILFKTMLSTSSCMWTK